ncbi:TetR/AcrR family transcriptional regulator [Actinomadura sp. GC306]|uniref:TetR/AcrR family transcriptional regulator n=1 Tax=Actinomadura sp. GC306 TaxID=2530367 RepID=UPI001A9F01B1|nr:TetR/AcrR family transcriptional regulator [Actinomadura sp. GC306]
MEAGIALLGQDGWPGVSTRAVAEHAGTNSGLIHYHFGGLAGLHSEVFRQATDLVLGPMLTELLAAPDERAALETLQTLLARLPADEQPTRLAAELIMGATRDPALGAVLRDELRRARGQIADRLRELHPGWPRSRFAGVAALIVASIDGLMLHHMIDGELPVGDVLSVVRELLEGEA